MSYTQRALAVFLVATMLLAAVAGGGMAATPTIDTSGTDSTSTQSELTDGTTINGTDGTAGNVSHTLQVNMTADNSVEMNISRDGTSYVAYENTSMHNHTANAGGAGGHHNGTVTEAELDDLERDANANVTTTLTVWNASNASESTSITVSWNFTDDRAVEVLTDNDTDSDEGVETFSNSNDLTTVTSFDLQTLEFSELDVQDMNISGDSGEAVVAFPNDTVADHASNAVPDGVSDKDPLFRMTLKVTADDGPDQLIRVYHEEAPDSVDDDTTYAVYKDGGIGGEDGIEINVGEQYEDASELSVTGTVNAGLIGAVMHRVQTSEFNPLNLGGLNGILTGSVPAIVFLGAVSRRRKSGV